MKTGRLSNEPGVSRQMQTKSWVRESGMDDEPTPGVSILGHEYLVYFGAGRSLRLHRVNKNKECSCGASDCRAIEAVRQYLQAGGARAPDPEGMLPCPICGAKTYRDRNWDGKYTRELGWRCSTGGLRHFLEAKAERIKKQLAENPWLIPPAPGYPGVRRDELMTGEECQAINRQALLENGPQSILEENDPTE
jgi:hypothetical protein